LACSFLSRDCEKMVRGDPGELPKELHQSIKNMTFEL